MFLLISHKSHITLIQFITIFLFICKSVYQNNSNYILFFIALYLNLAIVQVDIITFLNYFIISVLYNILIKKLKNIISSYIVFIKEQMFNNKLIDI